MFGVFGPKDTKVGLDNRNYSSIISTCDSDCRDCPRLRDYKQFNDGQIMPPCIKSRTNLCETRNDFNLIDHGFCIVKVSTNTLQGIHNCAWKVAKGNQDGINFKSLGQEEIRTYGSRDILDNGSELNSELVLRKKLKKNLLEHLDSCVLHICRYLTNTFYKSYELKGRIFLRSREKFGNQLLQIDGKPDCTCGLKKKK